MTAVALRCEPWDLLYRDPTKAGEVIDLLRELDAERHKEVVRYIRYISEPKTG